jgi:uncharacterized cysteine cluster protein YcgN (CxxCxxCC family)
MSKYQKHLKHEAKCHKCGHCCRKFDDDLKPSDEFCQHIRWDGKKATCSVYKDRIGKKLSPDPKDNSKCASIFEMVYPAPNCAYKGDIEDAWARGEYPVPCQDPVPPCPNKECCAGCLHAFHCTKSVI